jgi:hypothetical protein
MAGPLKPKIYSTRHVITVRYIGYIIRMYKNETRVKDKFRFEITKGSENLSTFLENEVEGIIRALEYIHYIINDKNNREDSGKV